MSNDMAGRKPRGRGVAVDTFGDVLGAQGRAPRPALGLGARGKWRGGLAVLLHHLMVRSALGCAAPPHQQNAGKGSIPSPANQKGV